MKIAIIGSKGIPATYGGVEKNVERLAIEFVKSGHEVTVYSRYWYSSNKVKEFNYWGIKVINIKGLITKRLDVVSHSFVASIYAALGDYDVVTYHSTVPGFFCVIPKIFGKKVFLHNHGLEFLGYKWNLFDKLIMKLLIILTSRYSDSLTTVSISQLNLCKKYYKKEPVLIPNGFDLIQKLQYNGKKRYILFVGRLVPDKGLEFLIKAFNELNNLFPEFKLFIIGTYDDKRYYLKIKNLASSNYNIEFLGIIYGNSLYRYYQEAYFIVVPSLIESFSNVLLEALWFNGAVICSDIEQFKLLAKDYVLFFNSKDVNSLKYQMIRLLKDPKLINYLVDRAKLFPFNEYDWSKISKKYLDVYSFSFLKNNDGSHYEHSIS